MTEVPPDHDDWLAAELARLYQAESFNDPGLLLGFPLWGATFIERFADLCLPSLLTPRNAEALRKMNTRIVIYTVAENFKHLWRKTWPIEKHGIRLEFGYFPKELVTNERHQKYRILGTVQNVLIQRAARHGMGFHMLMPDTVYSERYFEALAGLIPKHEAIANSCLSSRLDSIRPELEAHRHDGLICVPAATLADMSWRHLHPYMQACVMNGREIPSEVNILIWRGKDTAQICAPHVNPVWIGPELCRRAPVLSPTTLDAEIPYFLPTNYYSPGLDDDMAMVEVSDDTKTPPMRSNFDEFAKSCWQQMNFANVYLDIFRRRTRIPVAHQANGMDDVDIDRQHKALIDRLVEKKGEMMDLFAFYLARNHRRMMRGPEQPF